MLKEMEESSCSEVRSGFGRPCSLLLYILSSCARCLGCSISSDDPQDPSTEEENGEDSSEEGADVKTGMASRRPRRPPASEGRGGQIN
ncbi:hypothetical protein OPV22_005309 [Ensete ventricosum]|uniref:Uncharacterized protein n=1 Tax=Ensete ventricosum TaxID=4639 RepID=A0AAV8RGB7_ENSVE|nr:hypothetical protein OPV22_005309 [Ensete ventricosum]